jgi:demethoxyubiquinone hydroxylase (CLK1/Coq7/Cat5 family)
LAQQGDEIVKFLGKEDTAGQSNDVQSALALEEQQHEELVERVQEVEEALATAIGKRQVLARTRRHLYCKVTEMANAELDHFENEESSSAPSSAKNSAKSSS